MNSITTRLSLHPSPTRVPSLYGSGSGGDVLELIAELFLTRGQSLHPSPAEQPVNALAHALQCAQLAELAGAPDALVVAALLHDVGHLIQGGPQADPIDDVHELRALGLLVPHFGRDVIEPIRLHVQAKRYLVSRDPSYEGRLSATSRELLPLQGGPMSAYEQQLFNQLPHSSDAIALRKWDDLAKIPERNTPPLNHFLRLADTVRRRLDHPASRAGV